MSTYDSIVIGSSTNALTAAAYLARDGRSVLILEPSDYLGAGVNTTASFADGFKADLGLISGRLDAAIIQELKLEQYGLELIERKSITSLLSPGRSFTLTENREVAVQAISRFSKADSERYVRFMQLLDMAADLLKKAYLSRPSANPPTTADQTNSNELLNHLRSYGARGMTEVIRLLVMPVRDLLDEWFENPELKGLLGSLAVRGLTNGPFAGGTTFSLLHHLAIGDGYFRFSARGGIGALAVALLAATKDHGAEFRLNVGQPHIVVKDGSATGIKLASGEELYANEIFSDYDARCTFRQLVDPFELEPEFNRQVEHVRYNGSVARVNLALDALPAFTGISEEALCGTIVIAKNLADLERAFDAAKYGGVPKTPFIEFVIPSLSDNSLAPSKKHVMSVWLQYASYRSKPSEQAVRELVLDKLSEFAPDLRKHILHTQVLLPYDFESKFSLSEGHLYGGDMTLSQAFYLRPIPGFAQYSTPINQLFLCGAATHPGGGISGLSGLNAAREVSSSKLAVSI